MPVRKKGSIFTASKHQKISTRNTFLFSVLEITPSVHVSIKGYFKADKTNICI